MSELTNKSGNTELRVNLFANVSTLALLGYLCATPQAVLASSDGRPTVWIELGSQLERVDSEQTIFAPPFFDLASQAYRDVMTESQRPSRYSIGGEGKISFEPEGTDWVFSAAVRYGRSNSARHKHHEGPQLPVEYNTYLGNPLYQYTPRVKLFGDGQTTSKESHLIVDFLAGKDVGLGLFGAHSHSTFSAGVRFAQFVSKADIALHARPVAYATTKTFSGLAHIYFMHTRGYTALLHAERNSHVIGPEISWDGSTIVARSDNDAQLSIDWGVNAAILFGRQRAQTQHETEGVYRTGGLGGAGNLISSYDYSGPIRSRSKIVTVPNVGGFAGLSLRFPNAKVSVGYRADLYFNALDNGIDNRSSTDQKFYGPFANISIGLGG